MPNSYPYILEVSAIVESRTLIFASDIGEAAEVLEERLEELMDNMKSQANLPDNKHILYTFDTRAAYGHEVAGSIAIAPGATVLEECEDPEHDHDGEDNA